MIELIKHLFKYNREQILSRSLMNCHVVGLHSIMLLEAPGRTIRMFITTNNHKLYENKTDAISLAYHPHHCDITLHCVYGTLTNRMILPIDGSVKEEYKKFYDEWAYTSCINTGKMEFKKIGNRGFLTQSDRVLVKNDSITLSANNIHTVYCPKNECAAWLVYEGPDDLNYKSLAWSNQDLSKLSTEGMYGKFTSIYEIMSYMGSVGFNI